MRIVLAFVIVLIAGSTFSSAQNASQETGRWCVINASDNARHCYFQRHKDCEKAIADGSGVCVPNEKYRDMLPEDGSK